MKRQMPPNTESILGHAVCDELPFEQNASPRPLHTRIPALILFWLLAPTSVVIGAILMVGHWYTLPVPVIDDPYLVRALADLRPPAHRNSWMAVHVLYAQCRCSLRIFEHLFETSRPREIHEQILLVGAHPEFERHAHERGFAVHVLTPSDLKRTYRIESAPLLLVLDPSNRIRYAGGYTDRKQGAAIRDLEIISQLAAEGSTETLPLFGCGVSKELQEFLDPIGIKYDRTSEN